MPHIDFTADARYFGRLSSNKLRLETTPNTIAAQDCDVTLVPLVGSDDCSLSAFAEWGGGSLVSFAVDLSGFEFNDGIEAVGGADDWTVGPNPWQYVPYYNDLISPATGNESDWPRNPTSGLLTSEGQGACGRKFTILSSVNVDNPQAAAIFRPVLIAKKIEVEYWWSLGSFHVEFSSSTSISYGPNKWLDLTLTAGQMIDDDENPLREYTLSPTVTLVGYDQNGGGNGPSRPPNSGALFDAELVATIPTTIALTLASNPV